MRLNGGVSSDTPSFDSIVADAVALRRELHRHPELGTQLPRTQAAVLHALSGTPGLELSTGKGLDSVTAVLRGAAPLPAGRVRPVVLLRGDMDALPVQEATGVPYASEEDGRMHACGHDLHTSGLVGALRYLAARRDELVADVVGMFQPAEESDGGARPMIAEGLLTAAGRRVDAAYALHVQSSQLPHGVFASRPGTHSASCDDLIVTVIGSGGHGSAPHRAQDPVPVAAEMVLALQTLVTRRFDALREPVVATVGSITAGTAANIIPDTARVAITLRSFSAQARSRLLPAVRDMVTHVAAAHGMQVRLEVDCDYPVTVNDPEHVDVVRSVVTELFGPDAYQESPEPGAGSEDFSFVLQEVPGAYLDLGAAPPDVDPATAPSGHSPLAVFDDAVLARSIRLLAELALRAEAVAE